MAAITLQRLQKIIEIAYEAGYHGCLDLKDTYAEEITLKLLDVPIESVLNKNDGWRIYKVKELKTISVGTMFEHITRGRGYVESTMLRSDHQMHWMDGTISRFVVDEEPWTDPMRLLGITMKIAPKSPPARRSRTGLI